jgi:hypothetical protein
MKVELELLNALYHDTDMAPAAMAIAGQRVWRTNISGRRYYRPKEGHARLSLTSFLSEVKTEKEGEFLRHWRELMEEKIGSKEGARQYVEATAEYGTCLHILIADFVKMGEYEIDEVAAYAYDFFDALQWDKGVIQVAVSLMLKNMAAIAKFFADYEVRVLATELPVLNNEIATCIDLLVEMNAKKYIATVPEKRKRIRAGMNLKSGKYTGKDHELQCAGEMLLFNQCFGDLCGAIDTWYILKPDEYHGTEAKYTLKDVTSESAMKEFLVKMELGRIKGVFDIPKKSFHVFSGKFVMGQDPSNTISIVSFDDFFSERISNAEKQLIKQQNAE